MDVNGDGNVDILSGSYSRMSRDMAGLFQVLYGTGDGFEPAAVLNGTDDEPLIIEGKKDTDRICTRPIAVDLDGDGDLDIVSGNFTGTFAVFAGLGDGKFEPQSELLTDADGAPLRVGAHSDPFFVDWDGDGDLDMLSGASGGGVYLCPNVGSKTEPKFGKPEQLVEGVGYARGKVRFGDAHITGPQRATRVWADDLNGDGKLDLLVGDSVTLEYPAEGLGEAAAREALEKWEAEQQELMQSRAQQLSGASAEERKARQKEFNDKMRALYAKRKEIVRSDSTGFVWVLYQRHAQK